MKKFALLLFVAFICSVASSGQNQNSTVPCDCFYPADFESDYVRSYPQDYTTCEGLIDTNLAEVALVSASVSLSGDGSSAFVLQEKGQCALFRNKPGFLSQLLFRYDEPKFVITEVEQGEAVGTIIDANDFNQTSYPVSGRHKFQYDAYDNSFWSFQPVNGYDQVASKQFVDEPGVVVTHQQTSGLGAGSYLESLFWVDFGQGSGDSIHANSFYHKNGWLSHSARHLNQVSIEKIGTPGSKMRLRSWYDPLNDYTWLGGDSTMGGIHDSKILGEPTDSIVQVSFWDNGNFRSWDETFVTEYADVNNDNVVDTVTIANLLYPSYSRGLVVELNNIDSTATIIEEYLPNGLFFGGAMGGFQPLDSMYTFCYGMVDGYEYPGILPWPEPEVNANFPLFGLVDKESGEKLFSGYYSQPGLVMYQLQAIEESSIVSQPEVVCEVLQNEMYRLSAPEGFGGIEWSSGELTQEIVVPSGSDYLFWQTDKEYNLVSKPIRPGSQCLITSTEETSSDKIYLPEVLNLERLARYMQMYNLSAHDIQGREVSRSHISTGTYILRGKNYASRHLVVD